MAFTNKMLEKEVLDYAAYVKLDLSNNFQTVQDVIDNMITRLEELTSVVQIIMQKNNDCRAVVSEDLCKYRTEISTLSKKVATLTNIIIKLQTNLDATEKQVEKAELVFGVNSDSKLTSFLKPFFKRNKEQTPVAHSTHTRSQEKITIASVLDNFDTNKS